jgi:hypothetical protein
MTATDPMPAANSTDADARSPRSAQAHRKARTPNSLTVWVSDQLMEALNRAADFDEDTVSGVVRRWLKMAAAAQGFYSRGPHNGVPQI